MTPEMVELANRNLATSSFDNVEFHLADIEAMPLESDSVDCVISNCVLNLVPEKEKAFSEIYRILKPGGRLAVSDIALHKTLPAELEQSVRELTGCITGAIEVSTYRDMLADAGFSSVEITDMNKDLNVYRDLRAPDVGEVSATSPVIDFDVNDYAASVKVLAIK
jgi:SAM-dependent methyltransferase